MKNIVVRLGKLSVRVVLVLAAYNAGAITISTVVGGQESEPQSENGLGLSGSLSDTDLALAFSYGPPPGISTETTAIGPGNAPSPNSDAGRQPALQHAAPSRALSNGIIGKSSNVSAPDFGSPPQPVDYRGEHPAQGDSDLAAWKSTSGTPIHNPEDWLFQMQFSQDPNYQQSEPEPFLPVPEPASGVVVLMGITGLAVRGRHSK